MCCPAYHCCWSRIINGLVECCFTVYGTVQYIIFSFGLQYNISPKIISVREGGSQAQGQSHQYLSVAFNIRGSFILGRKRHRKLHMNSPLSLVHM